MASLCRFFHSILYIVKAFGELVYNGSIIKFDVNLAASPL